MSGETWAFCLSFICGVGIMLFWDILHGMRHSFFHGVIGNILLDVLWWFVSVTSFLWCIWETVALRLRFFEMFAMLGGIMLYRVTVSEPLRRVFCGFFDIILKIIKFIFKILLTPARFLDKILIEPFLRNIKRRIKGGERK